MRIIRLCILAMLIPSCCPNDQEYFGYVNNGDKATVGLKLILRGGVVLAGELSILSPEYPEDTDGIEYPLKEVVDGRNGVVTVRVRMYEGPTVVGRALTIRVVNMDEVGMEVLVSEVGERDNTSTRFTLSRVR